MISMVVVYGIFAGTAGLYAQGKAAAEKEAGVLKGDDKGVAANNRQCKLFSTAEASGYIGEAVHAMENAGSGYGCP